MTLLKRGLLAWIIALALTGSAAATQGGAGAEDYEARLLRLLDQIQQSRLDQALEGAQSFIRDYPRSRVGQLIYGDLLLATIAPVREFGGAWADRKPGTVSDLKEELVLRWRHGRGISPARSGLVPENLLEMGTHPLVIFADLGQSRLYVYSKREGVPRLLHDYYLTIGRNGSGKEREGDQRTPVGVYRVTSFIGGDKLPDLYGPGAFPIDYPNVMDRRHRRTGSGIWLHGSPSDTYSRSPKASDGCLVLSNPDLQSLRGLLKHYEGVPVVIAHRFRWVSPEVLRSNRNGFLERLEQWRRDWESLDTDRYLSHYSAAAFHSGTKDYTAWAEHKQKVNTKKRYLRVKLEDIDIFAYPGETDTIVVHFEQDYDSSNYRGRSRKQQYWKRDADGRWRIIHES